MTDADRELFVKLRAAVERGDLRAEHLLWAIEAGLDYGRPEIRGAARGLVAAADARRAP